MLLEHSSVVDLTTMLDKVSGEVCCECCQYMHKRISLNIFSIDTKIMCIYIIEHLRENLNVYVYDIICILSFETIALIDNITTFLHNDLSMKLLASYKSYIDA